MATSVLNVLLSFLNRLSASKKLKLQECSMNVNFKINDKDVLTTTLSDDSSIEDSQHFKITTETLKIATEPLKSIQNEQTNNTQAKALMSQESIATTASSDTATTEPADSNESKYKPAVKWKQSVSLLDFFDSDSLIRQSKLSGLVMFYYIILHCWSVMRIISDILLDNEYGKAVMILVNNTPKIMALVTFIYVSNYFTYFIAKGCYIAELYAKSVLFTLCLLYISAMLYFCYEVLGPLQIQIAVKSLICSNLFAHLLKAYSYVKTHHDMDEETLEIFKPYMNFTYYNVWLFSPTLIYDINYPRNEKFRPGYFVCKLCLLLLNTCSLVTFSDHFIGPVVDKASTRPFIETYIDLVFPMVITGFIIFFLYSDNFLNVIAEIIGFADRDFYLDWWNCTTFQEFSRKWNTPVHLFLRHYIYKPFFKASPLQKQTMAILLTLIFSGICHEVFLTIVCRVSCLWLTALALMQMPLTQAAKYTRNDSFNNGIYWLGLVVGVPLLGTLYARAYIAQQ